MANPTDETLLDECKIGLDISEETTELDRQLKQKIHIVKAYMLGAGVPEKKLNTEYAYGVIAMGVADLWELESGKIKFSEAFHMLLTQLASGG